MLVKKNSSHFDIGGVYMLHRGTFAFSSNHDYTNRLSRFLWFIGIPVLSDLHVPRVKKTPSLEFSGDGLLLSKV